MGQQLMPVTRNLLIINVLVYFLQDIFRINFPLMFGLYYFESIYFRVWQIMTYMFVHGDFYHLLGNMLGLLVFGSIIEMTFGSRRFLSFYMVCGMFAGVFHYAFMFTENQMKKQAIIAYEKNPTEDTFVQYLENHEYQSYSKDADAFQDYIDHYNPEQSIEIIKSYYVKGIMKTLPVVGASGALFGVLIAIFLLFPNMELYLLFIPIPIKAKYLIGFYLFYNFYASLGFGGQSNVAYLAHLGGAIIGFILIRFWGIKRQF